jgi:hypothetical protein
MQVIKSILLLFVTASGLTQGAWQSLEPGLDLGKFSASKTIWSRDSQITVLRIDPELWALELIGISLTGETKGKTARQWSKTHRLTAAINAGMFATDHHTHIGYLRSGEHVNNDNINSYRSVAVFDPRREALPPFRIVDLDSPGVSLQSLLRDYASAVQNLRLIKRPGENRWQQQEKRWIEAALGEDASGRILFIFSPAPYTMHDLNNALLNLDIGLVTAQHLEGGSQAQLYVNAGGMELELSGSQGNTFHEEHGLSVAWPIPNVLGVRPREREAQPDQQQSMLHLAE